MRVALGVLALPFGSVVPRSVTIGYPATVAPANDTRVNRHSPDQFVCSSSLSGSTEVSDSTSPDTSVLIS